MREQTATRKLDQLLQKRRSDRKTELVHRVLALNESATDKALRIVMIDLLPEDSPFRDEGAGRTESTTPEPVSQAQNPLPFDEAVASDNVYDHLVDQPNLLATPPAAGLWAYIFGEYFKIRRFGRETQTLVPGFFPFALRLSETARAFQAQVLPELVVPSLEQQLQVIRAQGWRILSKLSYNLMVGVSVLTERVRQIEPVDYLRDPRDVWDQVLLAAAPLYATPDALELTVSAWNKAAQAFDFSTDDHRLGTVALKILLGTQPSPLSLSVFLEVVQMLKFRRALGWKDLLVSRSSPNFSTVHFDCSPQVQAEIDRYLEELSDELNRKLRSLNEARRLRFYLSPTPLLHQFIEGFESSEPVVWTRILLGSPLRVVESLLVGNVHLASNRTVILFDVTNVQIPLQRLRTIHQQLLDPTEQGKPDLVRITVVLLTSLAWTLAKQLDASLGFQSEDSESVTFDATLLNSPLVVDQPAEFAGMSIQDALIQTTRFLLASARNLGAEIPVVSEEEEAGLRTQLLGLLSDYVRIASPAKGREKQRQFKANAQQGRA